MPVLTEVAPGIRRPVVWAPIPGTSQELALDSRAQITLFTGTRGPGKTDTQLMRFKRRVGIGYGPFWRGIIFDREYKNLDDLVSKSKRWFHAFNDGAEWLASTSMYKWVWPTGEELLFRSAKDIDDYANYHGQEYPYQGWNELTKYPDSGLFDMMMSCNRSSFTPEKDAPLDSEGNPIDIPDIPLEVFATTNSYGPGHGWVKDRFIDAAPYGQIVRTYIDVFNPRTQKQENVERTQVTIFGSYKENIYLDPIYIAGMVDACKSNENLRKSWLEGDWDVVAGGALDDVWKKSVHVIPRFQIPDNWFLDRAFDWGSSKPFSVGWWAESNGEEVMVAGQKRSFPRGSLIQCAEWYGTAKIGTNKGLKMAAGDVAVGIRLIEQALMENFWLLQQPLAGPADNEIRNVRDVDEETIEKKMSDRGIRWQESDKSKGSRSNGLELLRERLLCALRNEGPGIYFMDNCIASIRILPALPRDEKNIDDVDTDAEDHPYDMVRYRVLKGVNRYATSIKVAYPRSA